MRIKHIVHIAEGQNVILTNAISSLSFRSLQEMKCTASIHSIGPFYLWYALMCERTGVVNFFKNWGKTWELFIVTRKALGLGNSKAEKKEVKEDIYDEQPLNVELERNLTIKRDQ